MLAFNMDFMNTKYIHKETLETEYSLYENIKNGTMVHDVANIIIKCLDTLRREDTTELEIDQKTLNSIIKLGCEELVTTSRVHLLKRDFFVRRNGTLDTFIKYWSVVFCRKHYTLRDTNSEKKYICDIVSDITHIYFTELMKIPIFSKRILQLNKGVNIFEAFDRLLSGNHKYDSVHIDFKLMHYYGSFIYPECNNHEYVIKLATKIFRKLDYGSEDAEEGEGYSEESSEDYN